MYMYNMHYTHMYMFMYMCMSGGGHPAPLDDPSFPLGCVGIILVYTLAIALTNKTMYVVSGATRNSLRGCMPLDPP